MEYTSFMSASFKRYERSFVLLIKNGVHPWSNVGGYGMDEINIVLTLTIIFRGPGGVRSLKHGSSAKLRPLHARSTR